MANETLRAHGDREDSINWEKTVEVAFSGKFCSCAWCNTLREDKFPEAAVKLLGPKGRIAFIRCWIMKQEGRKLPT